MLLSLESPNRSTLGTEAKDKNLPKREMMEYIKMKLYLGQFQNFQMITNTKDLQHGLSWYSIFKSCCK